MTKIEVWRRGNIRSVYLISFVSGSECISVPTPQPQIDMSLISVRCTTDTIYYKLSVANIKSDPQAKIHIFKNLYFLSNLSNLG